MNKQKSIISKKKFIEILNKIEKQINSDVKFANAMSKAFVDSSEAILLPPNRLIFEAAIELLEIAINDNGKWIDYYLYELDCGKKSNYLKVYDKEGAKYTLSNASKLYDFLILVNNREIK